MKHFPFYKLVLVTAEIRDRMSRICRGRQQMDLALLYPAGPCDKVLGELCVLDVPVPHGKILLRKISPGDLQIPVVRPNSGSTVF